MMPVARPGSPPAASTTARVAGRKGAPASPSSPIPHDMEARGGAHASPSCGRRGPARFHPPPRPWPTHPAAPSARCNRNAADRGPAPPSIPPHPRTRPGNRGITEGFRPACVQKFQQPEQRRGAALPDRHHRPADPAPAHSSTAAARSASVLPGLREARNPRIVQSHDHPRLPAGRKPPRVIPAATISQFAEHGATPAARAARPASAARGRKGQPVGDLDHPAGNGSAARPRGLHGGRKPVQPRLAPARSRNFRHRIAAGSRR